MTNLIPGSNIPDLGAGGRPQQVQIAPSALIASIPNLPPELLDGERLINAIRLVFREEFDRLGLVPHSEYEEVSRETSNVTPIRG